MLDYAAEIAAYVPLGAVIYLEGILGAGKTTFARGFLRGLGYTGKVKSPTYTLVEPYQMAEKTIYHFDLYRLHNANELKQIGIEEYSDQASIVLIEWAEKGMPLLPAADLIVHIDFVEAGRSVRLLAQTPCGAAITNQL